MPAGKIRKYFGDTLIFVACFAVGVGAGYVMPDCSGYEETVAEQVLDGRHELVPPDGSRPDVFFTYTVRQLGDGWTAEDVNFTWRRPDGTLVEDSMASDRVSFALVDFYETPWVAMVLRRDMSSAICNDDEDRTPQLLTHACTAMVVIYCTPEQLQRAFSAAH